MIDNHDPLIIVLDRRMFGSLLHLAEIGFNEAGVADLNVILRHVRKFNPHFKKECEDIERREREEIEEDKRKTRELFSHKPPGSEVYVKDTATVYIPAIVIGISDSERSLKLRYFSNLQRREVEYAVAIWNIAESIPEGWQLHIGDRWNGCWVALANGG